MCGGCSGRSASGGGPSRHAIEHGVNAAPGKNRRPNGAVQGRLSTFSPAPMSTRREVRERAMQALYAYEQGGGAPEDVLKNVLRPSIEDDPTGLRFAERLFLLAVDRADETDALIQQHVRNWEIGRIALVDRLLLRMALTELLAFEDIPPKVSINEAIEIAKRFSTPKSGKFINGILDAALLGMIEAGTVKKSGRGLVGMPQARPKPAPATADASAPAADVSATDDAATPDASGASDASADA